VSSGVDGFYICPRNGVCRVAAPGLLSLFINPNKLPLFLVAAGRTSPAIGVLDVKSDGSLTYIPPM
jgi:hypothetical protein